MTTLDQATVPGPRARVRKSMRKATPAVRPLAHNPVRAAELVNLSPSTINNEIRAGRLRARRRGRNVLVTDDDLRAYVESLPIVK